MIRIEETKIVISMTMEEAERLHVDLGSMTSADLHNKYLRLGALYGVLDSLFGERTPEQSTGD